MTQAFSHSWPLFNYLGNLSSKWLNRGDTALFGDTHEGFLIAHPRSKTFKDSSFSSSSSRESLEYEKEMHHITDSFNGQPENPRHASEFFWSITRGIMPTSLIETENWA